MSHPWQWRFVSFCSLVVLVVAAATAEEPKFRPAAGNEPVTATYRVTLEEGFADAGNTAREIASTYGGRIESDPGAGQQSFAISMPPSRARVMSMDGRVQRLVEQRARFEPVVNSSGSLQWTYSYDGSGNISKVRMETTGVDDTFVYDTAGRLVSGMVEETGRRTPMTPLATV